MIEIYALSGLYVVKLSCTDNNLVKQRAFKTYREALNMVQGLQLHVPENNKTLKLEKVG